jgi:hypothetical protein
VGFHGASLIEEQERNHRLKFKIVLGDGYLGTGVKYSLSTSGTGWRFALCLNDPGSPRLGLCLIFSLTQEQFR